MVSLYLFILYLYIYFFLCYIFMLLYICFFLYICIFVYFLDVMDLCAASCVARRGNGGRENPFGLRRNAQESGALTASRLARTQ